MIKKIIEKELSIEICEPRKKTNENIYRLSFRNKHLENLFISKFNFQPGSKAFTINIPSMYKNTDLEKYYWQGIMDGDGIIAQNGKKIALELCNRQLIINFQSFLRKNCISTKIKEIMPEDRKNGRPHHKKSYLVIIKSPFYRKYAQLIGFKHPRKRAWLLKNLSKNKDFYIKNQINIKPYLIKSKYINYTKIFNSNRIYVVNGKEILKKYKVRPEKRSKNIKFIELHKKLSKKIHRINLLKEISNYKFKMSKGSTNSVKMPLCSNSSIIKMANFTRSSGGSVRLSNRYIKAFNNNPKENIQTIEDSFDIKVKYTSKKEPIFCSGVLELFFSKIIKRNQGKENIHNTSKNARL